MSLFNAADWPGYAATATYWRSPAASGGSVSAMALAGTVTGVFVPGQQFSPSGLAPAPDGLAGGRYDLACIVNETALRVGDELRRLDTGGTVKVQKLDRWNDTVVAFGDVVY